MWPDQVSNPGPLTYQSSALPTTLRGPAEKSQPEDKWIMPETRFTEFPALSVDPRVGTSQSALETCV